MIGDAIFNIARMLISFLVDRRTIHELQITNFSIHEYLNGWKLIRIRIYVKYTTICVLKMDQQT